jgi:hypothetical protein
MTDQLKLSSILPSTAILGTVTVIAVFLTVSRGWADGTLRSRLSWAVTFQVS